MSQQAFLRALMPWHRRQAPPPQASIFDARREQAHVSEQVLRRTARLLAEPPVGEPSASTAKVQAFCDALTQATEH